MADTNQQQEELAEILARVNDELRRLGGVTEDTEESLRRYKAQRDQELKAAGEATADAFGALASAATGAGKAMYNGEKGAAAFNSTIDSMATAVSAAGVALTFLIPGGPLVKAAVAGLTAVTAAVASYTKAANEMSDKVYKAFNGLANSGAVAGDGMTGVFRDAKKLGLSMNELDGFVQLVGENSKDLALFAGTAFEGRKKFADLGKAMEPFRESLYKAGLTQEQVNKGSLGYVRLQSQIGVAQTQTTEQLAEGVKKYLIEQDALTKLTGVSRDEAEKQREEIRSQERFGAKLLELRQAGREKEAKQLEDAYLILRSQSKEAAQGFADISTNNVSTEAAQKSLMGSQGKSMEVAQKISAGQLEAAEGAQIVAKAHGETAKSLGATLGQVGAYNDVFGDLSSDIKLGALAAGGIDKQYQKIKEDQKKQGVEGGKADDALLDDRAKLIKTQQDANKAIENFVFEGVGPAQKAMIVLAEYTKTAAEALNKVFGMSETGGEQAGAFTEEEKTAAQPMLAKASQEREIYASKEFKDWQKEQGANFLQKGMYHEKYGVAAYMKAKGIEIAKPVERASGSFGLTGKLIEDFGKGTPAILHGREGVITEEQLRQFGEQAMGMAQGVTAPTVTMPTAPTVSNDADQISEKTSKAATKQLDVEEDSLTIKEKNYAALKKQNRLQNDLLKEDQHICYEEVDEYKQYVNRKDKYYKDMITFLDTEFATLKETIGGEPGSDGVDVGGGGILAFFGLSSDNLPGAQQGNAPSTAQTGESPAAPGGGASSGGGEKPDLATITTKSGKTTQVGKHSQTAFQGIIDWLEGQGYKIHSLGGYVDRDVRGKPGVKSAHARGAAIDINPGENPMGSSLVTDMPAGVGEAADKLGLGWGGNWSSRKDAMHFSSQMNEGGDIIKAASGGLFEGPTTGYPAVLHGTEAVIPMNDGPAEVEMPNVDTVEVSNSEVKEEIIGMRDDIRGMIVELTQAITEANDVDAEENIVALLENIARHQDVTLNSNRKLVQQKANG